MNSRGAARLAWAGAVISLAVFVWAGLGCIDYCSATYDEPAHLVAGYSYWKTRDFRLDQDVPPLTKLLAALPCLVLENPPFAPQPKLWDWGDQFGLGVQFLFESKVPADRLLFLARLPMLGMGLALVLLCGWWARRLWGTGAGLTALALAAFDPNLIGHASTVNSDVAAALFSTLALYAIWEYSQTASASPRTIDPLLERGLRREAASGMDGLPVQRAGWFVTAGLAVGLGLVSKHTCLLLLPAVFVAGAAWLATGRSLWPGEPARTSGGRESLAAGLFLLIAASVIPPFHFFGAGLGFGAWLEGLRVVREHMAVGHPSFLLGEYSLTGWWLFYPIVFLVKTPLGTIALTVASLVFWRRGERPVCPVLLTILWPAALYFGAACAGTVDIGARHLLPFYALCWIAAGRTATIAGKYGWLVFLAVAFTAASSLAISPHQLAYFNELVGGAASGHVYLLDSNLDWGQDLKGLEAFLRREGLGMIYFSCFGSVAPGRYGIRYRALPSNPTWNDKDPQEDPPDTFPAAAKRHVVAVSASNLQGLWPPRLRQDYGWLLARKPLARIGYGIWVWEITGDARAHARIAETFLRWNKPRLAARELRLALELAPDMTDVRRLLEYLERKPRPGAR